MTNTLLSEGTQAPKEWQGDAVSCSLFLGNRGYSRNLDIPFWNETRTESKRIEEQYTNATMLRGVHAKWLWQPTEPANWNETLEPPTLRSHWAVSDSIPYGHNPSYNPHRKTSINIVYPKGAWACARAWNHTFKLEGVPSRECG